MNLSCHLFHVKGDLNLGWVFVSRWRVNLLSFVLVDGTIRSLGGWYILWRWCRHLRKTVQFSTGQTGWGKCSRIHKSTDTMTQHWTPCILPIYAVRGSDVDTLSQIDSASYANRKTPPPSQISPLGYWNCFSFPLNL